jgi:hypothetical protein
VVALSLVRSAPTAAELVAEGKRAYAAGKTCTECPYTEDALPRYLWRQGYLYAHCAAVGKPMPARSPSLLADDYPMNAIARAFMGFRKHLDLHGLDHNLARKVVLEWLCEGYDNYDDFVIEMKRIAASYPWPVAVDVASYD